MEKVDILVLHGKVDIAQQRGKKVDRFDQRGKRRHSGAARKKVDIAQHHRKK